MTTAAVKDTIFPGVRGDDCPITAGGLSKKNMPFVPIWGHCISGWNCGVQMVVDFLSGKLMVDLGKKYISWRYVPEI